MGRHFKQMTDSRGQSLVETALTLPLLLMLVLNAVNFGYYFLVTVNLTAASRSSTTYAILGGATPAASALPPAGPATNTSSVSYLTYQDMTGALWNPTAASVQVCSQTNLNGSNSGINGSGVNARTNCVTCSGSTCGSVNTGAAGMVPSADPEAPSFVLNRVDITYSFPPLIPGTPFSIALLSVCPGGTCTFVRHVEMRAME